MRQLFYILFGVLVLSGCSKKSDDLFDEPADIRLQKVLDAYENQLMQAPGWKLFVYPQGLLSQDIEVGGLTYYVRFPDSNRTVMVSDFTIDMASVPKESSFRLRAIQRPTLVFDTYSYIHVAADPDQDESFSPTGTNGFGWGTDFDFAFTQAEPSDTIVLKGNFNSSDAYLIKATQEEMDAAFSGQLGNIMQATNVFVSTNNFLFFPGSGNLTIGVSFNMFLYRVNFTYLDNGTLVTTSAPFSHTTYGLHFKEPITVGGYTFGDLFWDDALDRYYFQSGGTRVDITDAGEPLFPLNAVLGTAITTITVPVDPLAGQSAVFGDVYVQVADNLLNSPYQLTLGDMDFVFDDQSKTMALNVAVFQDGVQFLAQYIYSYQALDANNRTRFAKQGSNGNGTAVENEMAPLLDYIENDVFVIDYFTANNPVLGQFISVDNPDFFFTGTLQ